MKTLWNIYTKIIVGVVLFVLFAAGGVNYYTKTQSDAKYYEKTQADTTFVKVADGWQLRDSIYFESEVDAFRYVFTIPMDGASISNPEDASTYYIGVPLATSPTAGAAARQMTLPFSCTLIGFSSTIFTSGTPTDEVYSIYLRKNNTTDDLLSDQFNLNTSGGTKYFSSSALNVSYTAGDKIEIKIVFPTWATNPTGVIHNFIFYFKAARQ